MNTQEQLNSKFAEMQELELSIMLSGDTPNGGDLKRHRELFTWFMDNAVEFYAKNS